MPFPKVKGHELASSLQLRGLAGGSKRLLPDDDSRTYAPGSEIDRATFWAHSTQGALWPLSHEPPRWDESTPCTRSISKTPSMPLLRWPASELPQRANLHSGFSCFTRFKNLPLTVLPTWSNCHARKTHSECLRGRTPNCALREPTLNSCAFRRIVQKRRFRSLRLGTARSACFRGRRPILTAYHCFGWPVQSQRENFCRQLRCHTRRRGYIRRFHLAGRSFE